MANWPGKQKEKPAEDTSFNRLIFTQVWAAKAYVGDARIITP